MGKLYSKELLAELRGQGVKRVVFDEHADMVEVEFFPRSALDLAADMSDVDDPREALTEPPPAPDENVKIPPAMARVLQRGSVS